mmetsp:Transcript_12358/g.13920  ORF Transcript_12358/g.13920 Transcript_12358/m.13920 type:complete len:424 (+) Transcript_12358:259-1530(+)
MSAEKISSLSSAKSSIGSNPVNKWNRNGYGEEVSKSPGKFKKEESEKVRKSIEDFCKTNGTTPGKLCSEDDNRTCGPLRGAWMEIAKVLPARTTQSIYRHGLRLMHPFKRGAWSEEESQLLVKSVYTHGKKWSLIGKILNRSTESCRDKYRDYGDEYTRGRWQDEETKLLEKLLREWLKLSDNVSMVQIGQMFIEKKVAINFDAISKSIGHRSRLACFKRFQKLAGLEERSEESQKKRVGYEKKRHAKNAEASKKTRNVKAKTKDDSAASVPASHLKDEVIESDNNQATTTSNEALIHFPMSTPNPIQDSSNHLVTNNDVPASSDLLEYDRNLVNALASSQHDSSYDVNWSSIRYPPGNAQERWHILLDEFMAKLEDEEDSVEPMDEWFDKPICEIARYMLSRSGEEEQAEIAARTVEAVFSI